MKRILLVMSVALVMAAMLVAMAVPALAAKPDPDAQGCENKKTTQLDAYCKGTDNGGDG